MSTPHYVCKHGYDLPFGVECGQCWSERQPANISGKGPDFTRAPTGGAQKGNHYYRVTVRTPMSDELDPYVAECADIIEALDMTFNEGECFKALWRACRARQGHGKPGGSQMYDAEKVAHYGQRVLAHAQRCATETTAREQ